MPVAGSMSLATQHRVVGRERSRAKKSLEVNDVPVSIELLNSLSVPRSLSLPPATPSWAYSCSSCATTA